MPTMQDNMAMLRQAVFDTTYGVTVPNFNVMAGKLSDPQAQRFIDYVIDTTSLRRNIRIEPMLGPQKRISKLGIGARPLIPGTSGVCPPGRVQANVGTITLQSHLVKAVATLTDEELEDNIEGPGFVDHFMRVLSTQIGNQLESDSIQAVAISSGGPTALDTAQLYNGFRQNIQFSGGHSIDGSTLGGFGDRFISPQKLSKAIKSIPAKYKLANRDMRFLMPPNVYQDFADLVGARPTILGDSIYRPGGFGGGGVLPPGDAPLAYSTVPVVPVVGMPETDFVPGTLAATTLSSGGAATTTSFTLASGASLAIGDVLKFDTGGIAEVLTVATINTGTGVGTTTTPFVYTHAASSAVVRGTVDGAYVILTHYNNLIMGIQRDVRIETQRFACEGYTFVVVTLRIDFQVENTDAAVIMTNLAVK